MLVNRQKVSSSILRKMFATTATVQKCPSVFIPTADSVFEQKKKKAAKNKTSKISIMVVHKEFQKLPTKTD